jgi:hypothetical protein
VPVTTVVEGLRRRSEARRRYFGETKLASISSAASGPKFCAYPSDRNSNRQVLDPDFIAVALGWSGPFYREAIAGLSTPTGTGAERGWPGTRFGQSAGGSSGIHSVQPSQGRLPPCRQSKRRLTYSIGVRRDTDGFCGAEFLGTKLFPVIAAGAAFPSSAGGGNASSDHRTRASVPHRASDDGTACRALSAICRTLGALLLLRLRLLLGLCLFLGLCLLLG